VVLVSGEYAVRDWPRHERRAALAPAVRERRECVLGSGEVGRRLAAGFCSRGHDVVIGSRDPGKPELREWLASDGAGVKAGTFGQALAW